MLDQIEFATDLRKLLLKAETFGYNTEQLKKEILELAEAKEAKANKIEMDFLEELKRNPV